MEAASQSEIDTVLRARTLEHLRRAVVELDEAFRCVPRSLGDALVLSFVRAASHFTHHALERLERGAS